MKEYEKKYNPGLYIVSTPIGNLEDITYRGINMLKNADIIYCEDTRVTKKLLTRYSINSSLKVYNDFSSEAVRKKILNEINNDKVVALLSDAGTPLISDPGYKLVRACYENKNPVIVIPGVSSLTASITISGLPTDKIYFVGFLSNTQSKRKSEFEKIRLLDATVIIFETSKKLERTLKNIREFFGPIKITIARELTKIHEEVIAENVDLIIDHLKENKLKGEIVLLFNTIEIKKPQPDIQKIDNEIKKLINKLPAREITNIIHFKYNLPKKIVYERYLELRNNPR